MTWFTTGDATPAPTGPDPIPGSTLVWIWVLQILSPIGLVATVVHVVRQSRRDRRLSFDAMLLIAWVSVAWQDPILNYIRPVAFANAGALNLGSFAERIPGWVTPNFSKMAYPLVFWICLYFWSTLLSILCCRVMESAKRRWPSFGRVRLILVGLGAMAALDLVLEVSMIRTQVIAWPGVVRDLSLWGGTVHQFPLYESVLWGGVWAAAGSLRYFRDDRGRTVVERGFESLTSSSR